MIYSTRERSLEQILEDIRDRDDADRPVVFLRVDNEDTVNASSGNQANRARDLVVLKDGNGGRFDLERKCEEGSDKGEGGTGREEVRRGE